MAPWGHSARCVSSLPKSRPPSGMALYQFLSGSLPATRTSVPPTLSATPGPSIRNIFGWIPRCFVWTCPGKYRIHNSQTSIRCGDVICPFGNSPSGTGTDYSPIADLMVLQCHHRPPRWHPLRTRDNAPDGADVSNGSMSPILQHALLTSLAPWLASSLFL